MKFNCKNRKNGCNIESDYSNLVDHIKKCKYLQQNDLLKLAEEKQNEVNMLKKEIEDLNSNHRQDKIQFANTLTNIGKKAL